MKQEFTVKKMVKLVRRVARQLLVMVAAEMKRYREAQQRGYAGGFKSFNSTTIFLPSSLGGGLVDVLAGYVSAWRSSAAW
jgi:hypothetical protein